MVTIRLMIAARLVRAVGVRACLLLVADEEEAGRARRGAGGGTRTTSRRTRRRKVLLVLLYIQYTPVLQEYDHHDTSTYSSE